MRFPAKACRPRPDWVDNAMKQFSDATSCRDEDAVNEMLLAAMEYCQRNGLSFDDELRRAHAMFTIDERD